MTIEQFNKYMGKLRMQKARLESDIVEMEGFMKDRLYENLSKYQRNLADDQYNLMMSYINILDKRIV